jgi:hypothetical protein
MNRDYGHKLHMVTFDFKPYLVIYEYNEDKSLTVRVIGKGGQQLGVWRKRGKRFISKKQAINMLTWAIYKCER